MNKKELIKAVAEACETTQKNVGEILDAAIATIMDVVVSGGEVAISGFGKFYAVERAEREARNPQTGETITIGACKAPKFNAGKAFKDIVNE